MLPTDVRKVVYKRKYKSDGTKLKPYPQVMITDEDGRVHVRNGKFVGGEVVFQWKAQEYRHEVEQIR